MLMQCKHDKSGRSIKIEQGVVVGNVTDKQQVTNPISRLLVQRYNKTLRRFLEMIDADTILEVGCGEGAVTKILLNSTSASVHSTDISGEILSEAQRAVECSPRITFEQCSIYDMEEKPEYQADLVVCCEVMEHLYAPQQGLRVTAALSSPYCIFSVPHEPLWRLLNLLRGSYWTDLGNTPGHVQHWSRRSFKTFISPFFEVIAVANPLPWTFILAKKRNL